MKRLIEMSESVMKRMRWRAFYYLRNDDEGDIHEEDEYYGLKTRRCPPQIEELKSFEEGMERLIGNIQF